MVRVLKFGHTPKVINIGTTAQTEKSLTNTDRQVGYKGKTDKAPATFYSTREWPLQLSLGIAVHQSSRSKELVDLLHSYNLSVDYSRIFRLETQLASAIAQQTTEEGLYVPNALEKGRFIFFAIDNSDFSEDTPDGKRSTHGTLQLSFKESILMT